MITSQAVQAAAEAIADGLRTKSVADLARAALEAAAPFQEAVLAERMRAALRFISPDDITPMGCRMLERILDEGRG